MKMITSFLVVHFLWAAAVTVLASDARAEPRIVQLPDFNVAKTRGALEIMIARDKGITGRHNSITALIVTGVKSGSVFERCGIKPGDELVSIQGVVFAGRDYTREAVIKMLETTEVTMPYYEFEICRTVKWTPVRRGNWSHQRFERLGPVETIRIPIPGRVTGLQSKS